MRRLSHVVAGFAASRSIPPSASASSASGSTATLMHPRIAGIAHRGASFEEPENTLAAVREGIANGADLIEIDVQRTKDGELVVVHDTKLRRTTNVKQVFPRRAFCDVGDFTYAEIQQLDAGSWKGARFIGARVPTLRQVLDVVHGSESGLLIEVKAPKSYPGIARDLDHELTYRSQVLPPMARGRLAVQSFDWEFMRQFHSLRPDIEVGLLGRPTGDQLVHFSAWATQINPAHTSVNASYLARVHELGMISHLWTVDTAADIRRAVRIGADGIISNRPSTLDSVLRSML